MPPVKQVARPKALGRHHRVLRGQCRVRHQRDQRVGRADGRKAALGCLAAQHRPLGIGHKDPVFGTCADLRVVGLMLDDLLPQGRIGDADDRVVLAVHPRGCLARGIQNCLQLGQRNLVLGIELTIGAMLLQGLEDGIHDRCKRKGCGQDRCKGTRAGGMPKRRVRMAARSAIRHHPDDSPDWRPVMSIDDREPPDQLLVWANSHSRTASIE